MVHKQPNERAKPRGRPFKKGNFKGKIRDQVLDDSGSESSFERGIVESSPKNMPSDQTTTNITKVEAIMPQSQQENQNKMLDQHENTNQVDETQKISEIVESLDFFSEKNKLSIRLTKKHNRMFRVQIFLNDGELEIRPMTYTGSNTAMSFWNLLKGALKK